MSTIEEKVLKDAPVAQRTTPHHNIDENLSFDKGPTESSNDQSDQRAEGPKQPAQQTIADVFAPCRSTNANFYTQPARATLFKNGLMDCATDVELGLLGRVVPRLENAQQWKLLLNVTDPFCMVTVGVQGAGKSHTMNSVLEACLLNYHDVSTLKQPMAALVCHYDQSEKSNCEAIGLTGENVSLNAEIASALAGHLLNCDAAPGMGAIPSLDAKSGELVVLCSPSFYNQRKKHYDDICEVKPLLFKWSHLNAAQIKALMRLDESSTQLYVSVILDRLRYYQRLEKTT